MSRPSSQSEHASGSSSSRAENDEVQASSYRIERLGPASRADLMITGRAKRSTAGNKLKALLDQELEKDEIFAEVENDIDFHADENEGIDIVDSDFDRDSDDNAAAGADEDESEGERELEAREKAEKQKKRAQARNVGVVRRPVPPPVVRKPNLQSDQNGRDAERRRISFAPDQPDAQSSSSTLPSGSRRSSARSSTVQSKIQVESRLSEAEQRRAALPMKAAPRKKATLTQDALIAEALEVEEENRESLRKYLELEEARRAKMRQRKDRIVGPFVRWVSVGLKTKVVEEVLTSSTEEASEVQQSSGTLQNGATTSQTDPSDPLEDKPETAEGTHDQPVEPLSDKTGDPPKLPSPPVPASSIPHTLPPRPSLPSTSTPSPTPASAATLTLDPVLEARKEAALLRAKATPASPTKSSSVSKVEKYERQARTLLSVEKMPEDWEWLDEFNALLGTHCDWESYPFVPARNRPPKPRQSICPITGLPAIYKCPRTGIPYANAHAYSVITTLLQHRYIWTGGNHQGVAAGPKGKRKERANGLEISGGTIGTGAAPPEMGIYVDSELETGPANVWTTARERQSSAAPQQARNNANRPHAHTQTSVSRKPAPNSVPATKGKARPVSKGVPSPARQEPAPPPQSKKPRFEVILTNALAPGDEASVMAAALNLPAGSTRSGRRVHRPE